MAGRHRLLAVVLFAITMHVVAIARSVLPAQDGLKFIRIAREFQTQPWADVVRGSDSHPLYPALVAVTEPVVAPFAGAGPDAWRIAAQLVAVIASVGLIVPIYGLTKALFDRRIAVMAAALAVLLPRAAEVGHETLSDSLGLFLTFCALWWGAAALRRGDWRIAACAGVAAGFGYLARPEVILVPAAITLAGLLSLVPARNGGTRAGATKRRRSASPAWRRASYVLLARRQMTMRSDEGGPPLAKGGAGGMGGEPPHPLANDPRNPLCPSPRPDTARTLCPHPPLPPLSKGGRGVVPASRAGRDRSRRRCVCGDRVVHGGQRGDLGKAGVSLRDLTGAAQAGRAPRAAPASARARRSAVGFLPQGRERPYPDSQLAIRRDPDRQRVVGRTVLAVCGHDLVGDRKAEVRTRVVPRPRAG